MNATFGPGAPATATEGPGMPRLPGQEAPGKGGHLVLVTEASPERIVFHNPSGHDPASQENVALPLPVFDRFFAGRGIRIDLPR